MCVWLPACVRLNGAKCSRWCRYSDLNGVIYFAPLYIVCGFSSVAPSMHIDMKRGPCYWNWEYRSDEYHDSRVCVLSVEICYERKKWDCDCIFLFLSQWLALPARVDCTQMPCRRKQKENQSFHSTRNIRTMDYFDWQDRMKYTVRSNGETIWKQKTSLESCQIFLFEECFFFIPFVFAVETEGAVNNRSNFWFIYFSILVRIHCALPNTLHK